MDALPLLIYVVPFAAITTVYLARRARVQRRHRAVLEESVSAGMTEPASLHPVIDPSRCLGCGTCVAACPETSHHDVLGLVDGKAALIAPTNCIGHGACRNACPFDAITLVFGSARRGVDIPMLKPNFETNVAGIFVAGELGGMGLIKNALTQGQQALEGIAAVRRGQPGVLDVLIVGAGPAGLAASLAAQARGLDYLTLEQEGLGGAVFQYPRGKLVMTGPVELPLVGKVELRNTSKEELLQFWTQVSSGTDLRIAFHERVEAIERLAGGEASGRDARRGTVFRVRTNRRELHAGSVLLAIGRRGTPRKLGVPGEELPKVVYRLIDPEQYRGRRVLVVGGGDSALEAAASLAELGDTNVALSYRGGTFQRAKPRNRERIDQAVAAGRLELLLASEVLEIRERELLLKRGEERLTIPNDAVIVSAGGVLPNDFLKAIGVHVETKYGTA
jgi:thioredoxin reductase/NAD-dependent dihydropyrimidine dehydrogenase PreA subunit